jgi:hypothetical protein
MICGTVPGFASNTRDSLAVSLRPVAAGTLLPRLAVGMPIARIDHTMADDLRIVAQVLF